MFNALLTKAIDLLGKGFLISSFFPVLIFFCSLLFLFKGRDEIISLIESWLSGGNVTKEIVKAVIGLFIAYLFSYLVYGAIPTVLELYQGQGKLFFLKKWWRRSQIKEYKKKKGMEEKAKLKRDAMKWCNRGFDNAYTEEPPPSEKELNDEIKELQIYFGDVKKKIDESKKAKIKNGDTIKIKRVKLIDSLTMLYFIASKKDLLETSEKLKQSPVENFPEDIKKKIRYDNSNRLLIFKGSMSKEEKNNLLALSQEEQYWNAIKTLFERSQFELINQVKQIAENEQIKEIIGTGEIETFSEWLDAYNEIYLYPDEKYIQATEFGTIMMNINTYPKSRYGIDMTCLWPRLLHVVSKEEKYFEKINDAKIYLDFTVVMSFFSLSIALIALFCYLPYCLWKYYSEPFIIIKGCIALILGFVSFYLFYRLSVGAAKVFGEMMKSSVDLFRRKLLKELNIDESELLTPKNEKEIWEKISNLIIRSSVKVDLKYKKEP